MEVVYQDLALAPHLNPYQNMFLGREIPRKGFLGKLGFMDDKAMRAKARAGFDELGGTVRSMTAQVGTMSGGQRQQIAIVRSIAWANKIVFLDEPTAALGVVQTKNVLDTIRRVRDKGIAVVLISPLHAGRPRGGGPRPGHAARHAGGDPARQGDDGRAAGRRDDRSPRRQSDARRRRCERHRQGGPGGGRGPRHPESLLKRIGSLQAVWILGVLLVIVAFFSDRRRKQVPLGQQLLADLPEHRRLGRARRRDDLRHHHLRDRPVGRLGARLLVGRRREAHGEHGRRRVGRRRLGILAALVSGAAWGVLNGFLIAKAKIPPLIVTLGSLSVALGLAQVLTGGIDIRSVPEAMTDFNTYIKILGIPVAALRRADRP